MMEDKRLIWQCRRGSRDALRQIYEKYHVDLLKLAVVLTTNGKKTWWYYPGTNTVRVENRAYVASECWFGSRFLEQLKAFHESGVLTRYETTSDKDPGTGKPRIVLRCAWEDKRYNGPRSMQFEFDAETDLLTGVRQWENSNWEGPATLVGEKITYSERLPDELFEFEIPPGATVVKR